MKYLGIDYGTKKIGIAKSDEDGVFAFPHSIIAPKSEMSHVQDIVNICVKEGIRNMVIGKSIDLQGADNPIERLITQFIEAVQAVSDIHIHRYDERMSTAGAQALLRSTFVQSANTKQTAVNAKAVRNHSKDDDAKVAAYILQGFLDMHRRL